MTPEDLIVDLRDIHEPARELGGAAGLSIIPLVVFALIVFVAWFFSRRRAGRWRREAAERLAAARLIADPNDRWNALVTLFQQVTRARRQGDAPDYLFRPLGGDAGARADELAAEISRRIS